MQPHAMRQIPASQVMNYLCSVSAFETGKTTKSGGKILKSKSTGYYITYERTGNVYKLYFYQSCPC